MPKNGYNKIYKFLLDKFSSNDFFTLDELAVYAGYKLDSLKVYYRNSLKNHFIIESEKHKFVVTDEIESFNEQEFSKYISQKKTNKRDDHDLSDHLRENSIQALFAAIEIHNKPNASYRYQIVTILIINSWELILKAYLTKYFPKINIYQKDSNTKPFHQILDSVIDPLGKEYFHIRENIKVLYDFRCNYIHFYQEEIDPLLYGIFQKAIWNYNFFLRKFFKYKLDDFDDLYILPIGFKRPISPIDYITEKSSIEKAPAELKKFLLNIIDRTNYLDDEQNQETILVPFSLLYKNEKRLKNADLRAAITGDKEVNLKIVGEVKFTDRDGVKVVNVKEDTMYDEVFTETYADVVTFCRGHIEGWKQNPGFHKKMKLLKKNNQIHKVRFLDPHNEGSTKKDFYSKAIYKSLESLYESVGESA